MKKLFLIAALFMGIAAAAQPKYIWQYENIDPLNLDGISFIVDVATGTGPVTHTTRRMFVTPFIRFRDSSRYATPFALSLKASIADVTAKLSKADSTLYASKAYLQKTIDSMKGVYAGLYQPVGSYALASHTHSGLTPTGGSTGQVLKKNSNSNYDYSWQADNSGGGGGTSNNADSLAGQPGAYYLNASNINTGTLNASRLPSSAVTLAGAQTLTNKTLTAPVINSPTGIVAGDIGGLGTLATQSGTFSGTSSGTNTGDETATGIRDKLTLLTGTNRLSASAVKDLPAVSAAFGVNIKDFGAVGDSVTLNTQAFINAIAALPARGGVILVPEGAFKVSADSIKVAKSIRFIGAGSANLKYGNHVAATRIFTTSSGGKLFEVLADNVQFSNIAIENRAASFTSTSAGIYNTRGVGTKVYDCMIFGFYNGIDFETGYSSVINNNTITGFSNAGLRVRDIPVAGEGTNCFSGCYDENDGVVSGNFIYPKFRNALAGILQESGGGMKIFGNKFNNSKLGDKGGGSTEWAFQYAYLGQFSGDVTSVLLFTGNSIENYSVAGIKMIPNGQFLGLMNITGNEFASYTNTDVIDLDFSSGSIRNVTISGNTHFNSRPGSRIIRDEAITNGYLFNDTYAGAYADHPSFKRIQTDAGTINLSHLTSTKAGMIPPALTYAERNALTGVPSGTMLYVSDSMSYSFYTGVSWKWMAAPSAVTPSSISFVASTGGPLGQTPSVTTTGANLLVASIMGYQSGSFPFSDSKGNTWTALNPVYHDPPLEGVRMFYCYNPVVGTNHSFTSNSSAAITVLAFSGVASSPFDQQTGLGNKNSPNSITLPSLTPSTNNQVIVVGLGTGDNAQNHLFNQDFILGFSVPGGNGSYGGAIAYKIQNTSSTVNPTATWTNISSGTVIKGASFKSN